MIALKVLAESGCTKIFNHQPQAPHTGREQQQTINKKHWILIKIIDFALCDNRMNWHEADDHKFKFFRLFAYNEMRRREAIYLIANF